MIKLYNIDSNFKYKNPYNKPKYSGDFKSKSGANFRQMLEERRKQNITLNIDRVEITYKNQELEERTKQGIENSDNLLPDKLSLWQKIKQYIKSIFTKPEEELKQQSKTNIIEQQISKEFRESLHETIMPIKFDNSKTKTRQILEKTDRE